MTQQDYISKLSPHLFWDIDKEHADMDSCPSQIIQRVLEYGTLADWYGHWMPKRYPLSAAFHTQTKPNTDVIIPHSRATHIGTSKRTFKPRLSFRSKTGGRNSTGTPVCSSMGIVCL